MPYMYLHTPAVIEPNTEHAGQRLRYKAGAQYTEVFSDYRIIGPNIMNPDVSLMQGASGEAKAETRSSQWTDDCSDGMPSPCE